MKRLCQRMLCLFATLVLIQLHQGLAGAYEIPGKDSKVEYLYVFGADSYTLNGKEDAKQLIFIDVPEWITEPVTIEIYDPDTGGALDSGTDYTDTQGRTSRISETITQFTVTGAEQLDQVTVGYGSEYNKKWLKLGPYSVESGNKIDDKYRFTVAIEGVSGFGQNLFKLRVKPEQSEAFTDNITFRLLPRKGSRMYFYPEVSEGTEAIVVENYDLDKEGGESKLYDSIAAREYPVKDSTSGAWSTTDVQLATGPTRKLKYTVTTTNQNRGNAGLRFKDAEGRTLPIYFKKGLEARPIAPPAAMPLPPTGSQALSCNRFTFDARSSYDPNSSKIEYLWDFGDGKTSTAAVVDHIYEKGGTYKVTLTVKDYSGLVCDTSNTTQMVAVNTPPSAMFKGPQMVCTGTAVTLDASATSDSESADLKYSWAFGDGTAATGSTVTKTFNKGGIYDVVLTVDDQAGTPCSRDSFRQSIRVNAAPTAVAGGDQVLHLSNPKDSYRVVFDGADSTDPDKDSLTYRWDFGDGQKGEGKRVEHVYAQGGNYQATLTVNDKSGTACSISRDAVNVNLNKAPIANAGQSQFTCLGGPITFDAAGSTGEAGETLTSTWDFGDGTTATGKTVQHTYKQGGDYKVKLMINDNRGTPVSSAVDFTNVTINSSPIAALAPAGKLCTGDSIKFDASGSTDADGDSLKYFWDFGDGTTTTGGAKVSHQYKKGGNYQVSVTADDGKGSACSKDMARIPVSVNTPPIANAGPNLACCERQDTAFDGSGSTDADGDNLTYSWDFGDGNKGSGSGVTHAYPKSGDYKVVLTVDDGSGTACSSSTSSFMATVNAKPVPIIKVLQK